MSSDRKVFISYSSKDYDFCSRLAQELHKAGFNVWMDKISIQTGEDWGKTIEWALENCTDLIAVHSSNSLELSYQAKGEWFHADYKRKRIYPIIIEQGVRLHPYFRNIHAINFSETGTFEEHLHKLIADMRGLGDGKPLGDYPIVRGRSSEYPLFYDGAGLHSTEYIIQSADIRHMAGLGHGFIVLNNTQLRERLGSGKAKLKMLISAPTDENLRILASWTANETPAFNFTNLKDLKAYMITDFKKIIEYTPAGSIELRVMDTLPPFSTAQFDPESPNGHIAVTFYPFHPTKTVQPKSSEVIARLSTVLRPSIYPEMYHHFRTAFEYAWKVATPMTITEFEEKYRQ